MESDEYGHKIKAFSLRMPPALRDELEKQKPDTRSLTEEINGRLEHSLKSERDIEQRLAAIELSLATLHEKIGKIV